MKVTYRLYDGTGDRPDVDVTVAGPDLHVVVGRLNAQLATTHVGRSIGRVVDVDVTEPTETE